VYYATKGIWWCMYGYRWAGTLEGTNNGSIGVRNERLRHRATDRIAVSMVEVADIRWRTWVGVEN
jgi:hypothetical protein